MIYDLPTSIEIGNKEYAINSDYRAILDICRALTDPNLNGKEKAIVLLDIFYPDSEDIPLECLEEAITKCFRFINLNSDEPTKQAPKLMDWEQDFKWIIAPVNRVLGQEIRSIDYLHWWTFIAAYYEIGDCLFAQIVRIRSQKAKGQPLDKFDAKWYREHRELVDLKTTYSEAEEEVLKAWGIK
jgi:hypothetical protein